MPSNAHLTLTAEDKTQAAFRSLNHSLSGMMQHVAGLKTQLLAIGAVTGFYTLLESAIDAGAEVERLSKTLGASTESLSQFKHVAQLAHVPFESLTKGWRLMEKNVSLAALGTGAAKDALQALGISATALKQLKPEDQFATLADALEQVQNPADKVRIAMEVFGRAGADLIPILDGGAKAMAAAREEANQFGLTLTETSTHQLAEAHEAMVRLHSAFHGATNTLAIAFAPALATIAQLLGVLIPKAADFTARAFIRIKAVIALALATVMMGLKQLFGLLGKLPGALGEPFRQAAQAADTFSQQLFRSVQNSEAALANLNAQQHAFAQQLTQTTHTIHSAYQPALTALQTQHGAQTQSLHSLSNAQTAYQSLLEKGKQLTQSLRSPQEVYRDQLQSINQLLQAGAINHTTYRRAVKQYQATLADATGITAQCEAQKKQVEAQVNTLANLFRNGLFAYLEQGWKGMVKSFEAALSAMAADLATSEISRGLFGAMGTKAANSGGSLLGQFFNDGLGKLFGFGGCRAEGGAVVAGHPYLVGERGVELFTPQHSGTIVSHEKLAGNAPSIVMHIHTPDAHSFRLSRREICRELEQIQRSRY